VERSTRSSSSHRPLSEPLSAGRRRWRRELRGRQLANQAPRPELLKEADGKNHMARPPIADDFAAIRARMEELRCERETVPPDEVHLPARREAYKAGTEGAGIALVMRRMLERVPT
jgi:hypothetical protein